MIFYTSSLSCWQAVCTLSEGKQRLCMVASLWLDPQKINSLALCSFDNVRTVMILPRIFYIGLTMPNFSKPNIFLGMHIGWEMCGSSRHSHDDWTTSKISRLWRGRWNCWINKLITPLTAQWNIFPIPILLSSIYWGCIFKYNLIFFILYDSHTLTGLCRNTTRNVWYLLSFVIRWVNLFCNIFPLIKHCLQILLSIHTSTYS